MPEIQKLHEMYKVRNVSIHSLIVWESGGVVKYAQKKRITYTIAKGDEIASKYKIVNCHV